MSIWCRLTQTRLDPALCSVALAAYLACLLVGFAVFFPGDRTTNQYVFESRQPTPVPLPTEINSAFLSLVNDCFLPVAALNSYTLRLSHGYRTVAEQDELYNQGRTVDGHIVTEAPGGMSIHNYGFAVDVVDRWREYRLNWKRLGEIAAYCGLEQGDDGDISHFEYRGGLTTEQFMQGLRPTPPPLPCVLMGERAATGQRLTVEDLRYCGVPDFSRH